MNSIKSRVFPCSQVMIAKCEIMSEAYKVAEVAEEAEKEILPKKRNNYQGNNIMTIQHEGGLLSHPFYEEFLFGQSHLDIDINKRTLYYQQNNANSYHNYFGHTRRSNMNRNYTSNNQFNGNKHYNNTYSFYNNCKYNSMNNVGNNSNRIQNENLNNLNPRMENSTNKNNGVVNNNVIAMTSLMGNIDSTESRNYNNTFFKNKLNTYNTCYRCNQSGHKVSDCPYTFKQLAEMEEKGLLQKPLNH